MRRSLHFALPFVVATSLAAASCGSTSDPGAADTTLPASTTTAAAALAAGEITVTDAWTRQPAAGASVAAVYASVTNGGDAPIVITGVTSDLTARAELHETTMADDGTMSMAEATDGFEVGPGETFVFEPGGAHVMLFDIDAATYPTDHVAVTFEFDGAEPITVEARVEALGGDTGDTGEMGDMGDMGESDTSDTSMSHDDAAMIDAQALHELDDELYDGVLDAARQRAVVADYIAQIEAMSPAPGSDEAALLDTLTSLDAALAAGDLAGASALATEAHDQAHEIEHHHG